MHDPVEVLHFIIHDAVQPHGRLFPRFSVHDGPIHFRPMVNPGAVIVLLPGLVHKEMLLFVTLFQRPAAVEHIQADGALCSLYQHIVLGPVESRAILQDGIPVVRVFHGNEQHVILVPELFPLVGHVTPCHGH